MKKDIILLVIGVIGLIAVYSLRPPSGLGEELMMMGAVQRYSNSEVNILSHLENLILGQTA